MGQVLNAPVRSARGVVEMESRNLGKKAAYGILGGIVGGLVFGALMAAAGALPLVARLVGSEDPIVGFLVHIGISAFIGATFVGFFQSLVTGPQRAMLLGTAYGFVWWIVGGLILMPVFLGMPVQLANALTADNIGGLVGHLLYGFALGATYVLLAARTGLVAKAPAKAPAP